MKKISWQDFLQMPVSRGVRVNGVCDTKDLDFQADCDTARSRA
jgi:hypothetical protein